MDSIPEKPVPKKEYSIWFSDSGAGGLFFLYDAYPVLNEKLKQLESLYDIKFRLVHFAELKPKYTFDDHATPEQVKKFARNAVAHTLQNGADISVLVVVIPLPPSGV